jgi:phosphomannomutase
MPDFRNLKAVVFDLDDTLAPSKSEMDPAMSAALAALLERIQVCIISGGRFEQFETQALAHLQGDEAALSRLHLMPTCGTRYYRRENGEWMLQYAEDLTDDEKQRAIATLEAGARELGYWAPGEWGALIEDRGSQITYSALGQSAPVAAKAAWDPDGAKKRALWAYVAPRLPDLEVRGGGSTSIDITRKGIDKAYGIRKLQAELGLSLDELLFIGDRLDETGNDRPVYELGVASVSVEDWHETLAVVEAFNAWWDEAEAEFPLTLLLEL